MAKLQIKNLLLLSKRSYGVATENLSTQQVTASVMRKAKDNVKSEDLASDGSKEEFWMRHPKTGNWIPESHFGDVDAAELREKFLSKKRT